MHSPYISIVATSRNDIHGGDMIKRMKLFVNCLIKQARNFQFPIELIIVEWNPPQDCTPLYQVLPKPGRNDKLLLRYVTVPCHIHSRYKRANEIPLFQMIAKNVGIRRAKGQFVLCTNTDLLFSNQIFEVLAKKDLRKDTFYRANRFDVPNKIDPQLSLEQQLKWCNENWFKRIGRDNRFKNGNLEHFGLNDKPLVKKWIFDKFLYFAKSFWPSEKRQFYQIDTFACGDFTLMSKEAWIDIQGYVELDLYSIHIDSLALIAATSLGYRQRVFKAEACTYHMDHPHGWESFTPIDKIKWLEERPGLGYDLLYEVALHILKQPAHLNLNSKNWGYADHEFEEIVFGQ